MAINYGAEIRRLANEYFALTGEMPFSGVEQRSATIRLYLFSSGSPIASGAEALGHMRELLRIQKAQPAATSITTAERTIREAFAASA
jgi:hypothetical protein